MKRCIGELDTGDEFELNKTFLSFSDEEKMVTGLVEEPYYTAEARSLETTLADLKKAKFRQRAMVVTDRGVYSMANMVLLLRSGWRPTPPCGSRATGTGSTSPSSGTPRAR